MLGGRSAPCGIANWRNGLFKRAGHGATPKFSGSGMPNNHRAVAAVSYCTTSAVIVNLCHTFAPGDPGDFDILRLFPHRARRSSLPSLFVASCAP